MDDNMETWERKEFIKFIRDLMDSKEKALQIIASFIEAFVSGEHYKTQNPYTRPYVKEALQFIAEINGEKDWLDANYKKYLKKD
jgi:hypothetical protein